MGDAPLIREARTEDAAGVIEVYRPYVLETAISFETAVPPADEAGARIATALTRWSWLVAELDGRIVGYAYGCELRARHAYRFSVETSAYVDAAYHRRGVAGALYAQLLQTLAGKGFCNAYAAITLPNEASVALHRKLGFAQIGVFPSVGWKFGRWHDVGWFHRAIGDRPPPEA